jgi:phosphinothricin acetyltransferase
MSIEIRSAGVLDISSIAAIYAYHVRHGLASFEIEPPGEEETRERFDAIRDGGYPYLVATEEGRVIGYAYASPYRARPGYRYSLEDSVYVDAASAGRGIGRRLLEALVAACEPTGCRQLVAVIGDSANRASIGLHAACGFTIVGTFRSIGFKHGRWVDSVLMQRAIGAGDSSLPEA